MFDQEAVDLVVTDLAMPHRDGFRFIQQIRRQELDQQPYILVMTSLDRAADRVRALDWGANDYVVKLLGLLELLARIRNGLRKAKLRKKLRGP